MKDIWLVYGDDVGGNTGSIVIAAFTKEDDANQWAQESPERALNNAFGLHKGHAFEVEPQDLYESLEEARGAE